MASLSNNNTYIHKHTETDYNSLAIVAVCFFIQRNMIMNKVLLNTALILAATVFASFAQEQDYMTYHSCDFTDGIPAEYATYDLDEQTLHYTMVQGGIKQGEAWTRKKEPGTKNYYAVSACRYKEIEGVELKPSDDWLITPAIWVRGKEAKLSWDAQSVKAQQKLCASYEVLISTTGNTPADFNQPAIFSINEEQIGEWANHEIDLSQYEGENIYIAFHNNSAQGDFIGIDNVIVSGHKGVCNMENTTGTHIFGSNDLYINVAFTSYANDPITDITLYYSHNNEVVTESVSQLNINKYETYNHTFATPIAVANGDTATYTIGATVNGIKQGEITAQTVAFMFEPTHCVVIEEVTGMWCTFCPAGIVAMEILKEKYPEQFIGIAVHYDDRIALDDYFNALGLSGLPSGIVNRRHVVAPPMVEVENNGVKELVATNGGFETYFLEELSSLTPCEVAITALTYSDNNITIDTRTRSAVNIDNTQYQLAFVIIEDHVWEEGYYQKNGYSGGDVLLNGWEEKPSMVNEGIAFDHVARAIYDFDGIEGSIPSNLVAGEEYTGSYSFELPSTILNYNNVKVIAMIINAADGTIVNATQSGSITAIDAPQTAQQPICHSTDGNIHVTLPSTDASQIAIYNISGALVASYTATGNNIQLPNPAAGAYIVSITQCGTTTAHKIVVR